MLADILASLTNITCFHSKEKYWPVSFIDHDTLKKHFNNRGCLSIIGITPPFFHLYIFVPFHLSILPPFLSISGP